MLNRLDARIAALFLGLLLLIQIASFSAIRQIIDRNARAAIATDLENSARILERLLLQKSQRMTESARLLTADFGFREAIATGDQATLVDALENHGARIGADAMMFLGKDLSLRAATASLADAVYERAREQAAASQQDDSAHIVIIRDRPQLLLTVPVRAPLTIGWVAMGFPLERNLLEDLFKLSGVAGSLVTRGKDGNWRLDKTQFQESTAAQLANGLRTALPGEQVRLDDDLYQVRAMPLSSGERGEVTVLLMRSIDAALKPFQRLQLMFGLITLAGVAVAAGLGWLTAKRVTQPLKALTRSAERLGAGDYEQRIQAQGSDEVGELARRFETMRIDIRERDQRITRLAYWDALTDLPNRVQFRMLLAAAIDKPAGQAAPVAVLMLDLDRFKHVNDVLGSDFGDRLLAEFGRWLQTWMSAFPQSRIARLGGDEFGVLLPGLTDNEATEAARRLLAAMQTPMQIGEQRVDLRAGIGMVVFPGDGHDADTLLRRAEIAMYAAKSRQAGLLRFDPAMQGGGEELLTMLSELRTAVAQDQLRLYLQPKVALADGKVLGAEALVRWEHPTRGMVPPGRFIPFAEQTGEIRQITRWMLEHSIAAAASFIARGQRMKIAMNLSARDLTDPNLLPSVRTLLAQHSLDPELLCLEITESAIMDDPSHAEQTLLALHELGVALSIDDFGTGYSSLAYLKRLPVDQLKIDRSFVLNLETDAADLKIVRSTIDLAHNLGLRVVAEGLEYPGGWHRLRELGCDEVQGYLIAKPMPESQFEAWMGSWQAPTAG